MWALSWVGASVNSGTGGTVSCGGLHLGDTEVFPHTHTQQQKHPVLLCWLLLFPHLLLRIQSLLVRGTRAVFLSRFSYCLIDKSRIMFLNVCAAEVFNMLSNIKGVQSAGKGAPTPPAGDPPSEFLDPDPIQSPLIFRICRYRVPIQYLHTYTVAKGLVSSLIGFSSFYR